MNVRLVLLCSGAAVAALLLAATPASAVNPCEGTTQADLNACAGAAYGAADTALNAVDAQLMMRSARR